MKEKLRFTKDASGDLMLVFFGQFYLSGIAFPGDNNAKEQKREKRQ